MPSRGGQRKFSEQLSLMRRPKPHGFAIDSEATCHPIIPIVEAVRIYRAESLFCCAPQSRSRIFRVAPDDRAATPRNKINQTAESQLVSLKVRINVGVIVFERGNDQIIGMVMKKLGPAIPERGFILIAFKNELFPIAKPIALAKVFRHASHEKIWPLARSVKNPSQHRRRGGFSMCAADDNGMSSGEKDFLQNLRHRAIWNLSVQHFLQVVIPELDDISDHHEVWRGLQVRGIKSVEE